MEIVTKRFLLRDFVEGDFPAFAAYHADPRSLEFYGAEEAKPGHARELLDLIETWAGEQLILSGYTFNYVTSGLFIALQFKQVASLRFFQQVTEGAKPIVSFVEARLAAF